MSIIKKTVVLSTNDNRDYLNYYSYVVTAWNILGWNTLTFYHSDQSLIPNLEQHGCINECVDITDRQSKYRIETRVQCIRLLAGNYIDEGLIMTSDIDMIPLSDYWKPQIDQITSYGYDLTGRSQIPMCYVAMNAHMWREIFPEKTLNELLDQEPNARREVFENPRTWETAWTVDQQILTRRLKNRVNKFVDRGLVNVEGTSLATGRVDRHNWAGTLSRPELKIDAHLPRPFNQQAAENMVGLLKLNIGND